MNHIVDDVVFSKFLSFGFRKIFGRYITVYKLEAKHEDVLFLLRHWSGDLQTEENLGSTQCETLKF